MLYCQAMKSLKWVFGCWPGITWNKNTSKMVVKKKGVCECVCVWAAAKTKVGIIQVDYATHLTGPQRGHFVLYQYNLYCLCSSHWSIKSFLQFLIKIVFNLPEKLHCKKKESFTRQDDTFWLVRTWAFLSINMKLGMLFTAWLLQLEHF